MFFTKKKKYYKFHCRLVPGRILKIQTFKKKFLEDFLDFAVAAYEEGILQRIRVNDIS